MHNKHWKDLMEKTHQSLQTYHFENDVDWKAYKANLNDMSYFRVTPF